MSHTIADQLIAGRPVADYTSIDQARRCPGHTLDNTAGYVVRHTIDAGQVIEHAGRVGVDVYAVESTPTWGNYDKAIEAARAYRDGQDYAVIDHLYRCGHRSY